jgi:hypothetical protein
MSSERQKHFLTPLTPYHSPFWSRKRLSNVANGTLAMRHFRTFRLQHFTVRFRHPCNRLAAFQTYAQSSR